MKKEIENYFATDGSYEKGVALVMEHSNRLALKKQLNIHPKSDYLLGVIHEELRTIANLSQGDIVRLKAAAVTPVVTVSEPKAEKKPAKNQKREKKTGVPKMKNPPPPPPKKK